MKKRLTVVVLATMAALVAFVGTSSASAATEFGSACSATGTFAGGEVSIGHGTTSPLPYAAPISGVITEWKVNVGTLEIEPGELGPEELNTLKSRLYQQLYVLKANDARHYYVAGKSESGLATVNATTSFLTRIPVAQGDLLALAGPDTLYCHTKDTGDKTAELLRGIPGVGAVIETSEEEGEEPLTGYQVPVVAKVEPDVDGDGYGDETQDKCPQSAAYHEACPVVTLSTLPIVGGKAVQVHVASSLSAPVAVSAKVAIGKGKTTTLAAPSQVVGPGSLAGFTLTLSAKVKKALATVPADKSLNMTIIASATNVTGPPSTSSATVKLKGLAKPVPKPKHLHKKSKQK